MIFDYKSTFYILNSRLKMNTSSVNTNFTSNSSILEDTPYEKIIDLSFLGENGIKKELNIRDREILTFSSFKELIEEKEKEDLPFLLSILESKTHGGTRQWHAFDSCALSRTRQSGIINNPMTGDKVENIFYFKIDSIKNKIFDFIGQENVNSPSAMNNQPISNHGINQQLNDLLLLNDTNNPEGSIKLNQQFIKLLLSANTHNVEDSRMIGFYYEYGLGIQIDLKEAVRYYQKAADKGDSYSLYQLGWCYQNGKGVNIDLTKAFEYFKAAAEKDYTAAFNPLAMCYLKGRGVQADSKKALEYLKEGARKGDIQSIYQLGLYYYQGKAQSDFRIVYRCFITAAKKGHVSALNYVGVCYEKGIEVVSDAKKAFEYYDKASQRGSVQALYNVGRCYEFGIGVEKSQEMAYSCYNQCKEKGYSLAVAKINQYDTSANKIERRSSENKRKAEDFENDEERSLKKTRL